MFPTDFQVSVLKNIIKRERERERGGKREKYLRKWNVAVKSHTPQLGNIMPLFFLLVISLYIHLVAFLPVDVVVVLPGLSAHT